MKPACLPEQLLWSWPGAMPARTSASAAPWKEGTCVPHSRSASPRPALASIAAAVSTWRGSPLWEEQASASSGIAEAVTVGGAALDQRQGLQRLDGGAREDAPADIADGRARLAGGIDHGDGAAV